MEPGTDKRGGGKWSEREEKESKRELPGGRRGSLIDCLLGVSGLYAISAARAIFSVNTTFGLLLCEEKGKRRGEER